MYPFITISPSIEVETNIDVSFDVIELTDMPYVSASIVSADTAVSAVIELTYTPYVLPVIVLADTAVSAVIESTYTPVFTIV